MFEFNDFWTFLLPCKIYIFCCFLKRVSKKFYLEYLYSSLFYYLILDMEKNIFAGLKFVVSSIFSPQPNRQYLTADSSVWTDLWWRQCLEVHIRKIIRSHFHFKRFCIKVYHDQATTGIKLWQYVNFLDSLKTSNISTNSSGVRQVSVQNRHKILILFYSYLTKIWKR